MTVVAIWFVSGNEDEQCNYVRDEYEPCRNVIILVDEDELYLCGYVREWREFDHIMEVIWREYYIQIMSFSYFLLLDWSNLQIQLTNSS